MPKSPLQNFLTGGFKLNPKTIGANIGRTALGGLGPVGAGVGAGLGGYVGGARPRQVAGQTIGSGLGWAFGGPIGGMLGGYLGGQMGGGVPVGGQTYSPSELRAGARAGNIRRGGAPMAPAAVRQGDWITTPGGARRTAGYNDFLSGGLYSTVPVGPGKEYSKSELRAGAREANQRDRVGIGGGRTASRSELRAGARAANRARRESGNYG